MHVLQVQTMTRQCEPPTTYKHVQLSTGLHMHADKAVQGHLYLQVRDHYKSGHKRSKI